MRFWWLAIIYENIDTTLTAAPRSGATLGTILSPLPEHSPKLYE